MIVHLFNSSLVSGPETLVIPALRELMPELGGVEVWFLKETRKGQAAEAPIAYARSFGLKCREIEVRSRYDRSAVEELRNALVASRPEIVHSHDAKASFYLEKASRRDRTWKLVSTHHGVHARSGFKNRLYERLYVKLALPRFDAVLCVCSSDRDLLIAAGLKPERVFVHLNGVDRPLVTNRKTLQAEVRQKWKADLGVDVEGKRVLGVVARLAPEKNHALLLAALSGLKDRRDWICLCFGSGPLERELKDQTQALGLEKQIFWPGYRAGLSAEMAGFDLLLSLSHGEGLPINLIEAGWAGTPILATVVDGVADLLPESDPGFKAVRLSPRATGAQIQKCLAELLFDPEYRERLGSHFQTRVRESFSGRIWRNNLLNIYRTLR